MARQFKLHAVNSDGSESDELIQYEVIDPETSKRFEDDKGEASVVITLRPISQAKYRQVEADFTKRVLSKKTRQMEERTDWTAVQDTLMLYTIRSWRGLIGADDKPLECVDDAKVALPGDLKNELIQRAMQGEAVDLTAASFRAAS